jgi:Polyketide cyclase / dehydrase and lipid transport
MFECRERIVVKAAPKEILEFVADFRRYAEADTKITRVREAHRDGNRGHVRHGGRLRGVPGPMLTSYFEIAAGRSLLVRAEHPMLRLEGGVTCTPADGGTLVEHWERFAFRGPLRWIADPLFRRWHREDLKGEMHRLKMIVESQVRTA